VLFAALQKNNYLETPVFFLLWYIAYARKKQ